MPSKNEVAAAKAGISLKAYKASRPSSSSKSSSKGIPSFKFNSKKATQDYTKLADAIYNPQVTALQNQQTYNTQLAEKQKVTTRSQFADLLNSTIESLNRRGAFFGGGALAQEGKINTDQTDALTNIDMATTQANLGVSSQIGELAGKRAEYIQSGVNSLQSSAYNQFQDSLQNYFKQQEYKVQEQRDALAQKNADRNYALSAAASGRAASNFADAQAEKKAGTYYVNEKGEVKKLEVPTGAKIIGGTSSYNLGLKQEDLNLFPTP